MQIRNEWKDATSSLEILIVDDDRIIQILHTRCVERCQPDIAVSTVENGLKALEFIEKRRAPGKHFLLLLDINMPVMNGWEFLDECSRRKIPNLFVIMVTSSTNSIEKTRIQKYPQVIGFNEKPFSEKQMKEIMMLKELKEFFTRS